MLTCVRTGSVRAAAFAAVMLVMACSEKSSEELARSAREYAQKGDVNAAVIQYRNAAMRAPQDGPIRLALGKVLMQQGDLLAADKELTRALELGQPADEVVPLLARVLNQLGRSSEVLKAWRATQLTSPEARLALQLELGEAEVHAGTLKAARETFAAALQARPGYCAGPYRSGTGRAQRRPDGGSQATCRRGDQKRPEVAARPCAARGVIQPPWRPGAGAGRVEAGARDRAAIFIGMGSLDCPDHGRWGPEGSEGPDCGGKPGWSTRFAHRVPRGGHRTPGRRIREGQRHNATSSQSRARLRSRAPSCGRCGAQAQPANYRGGAREARPSKAPDDESARRLLASVYLSMRDGHRALNILQPLLAGKSPTAAVLALAGEAELLSGDMEKA